jgi:hypothetical protein
MSANRTQPRRLSDGTRPKGYQNGPDDFEQIAHIARVTIALTKQKQKVQRGASAAEPRCDFC